jgi:hypothetical protein
MKKDIVILLLSVCASLFVGCRTTKQVLDDYERNITIGDFKTASVEVSELASDKDDSQLLYELLSASAFNWGLSPHDAIMHFNKAEDIFLENDKTSVFSQVGGTSLAMVTNDRSFPFNGDGQDRVFTCLYKAINHLTINDKAGARTELNRAEQHQENWLWNRRKDIDAAKDRMEKDSAEYAKSKKEENKNYSQNVDNAFSNPDFSLQIKEKTGFDPATSGNLDALSKADWMNLYVHHVTGVFRWITGGASDGRNFMKDLVEFQPENPLFTKDYADIQKGVKPKNQVWVYVEDGLCPKREEWRLDLPVILIPYANRYVLYAGMALPVLCERDPAAVNWSVGADGRMLAMSHIANVDKLIRTEYDVYMRGALAREITRTIVKVASQVALGIAADNTSDNYAKLGLRIAQMGVATWALTTTAADLRSWTSLPKNVYAQRVDAPTNGILNISAGFQNFSVNIPQGKNVMVFIRKTSTTSAPIVQIVALD